MPAPPLGSRPHATPLERFQPPSAPALARLSLVAASVAALGCTEEDPLDGSLDLLARRPDHSAGGATVDAEAGSVRLEPGAEVRYRIEPRAEGEVRLRAHADGEGTLAAGWSTIDRSTGAELAAEERRIEGAALEREHALPLGSDEDLLELRLAWEAPQGSDPVEIVALRLEESATIERPSIVLVAIDTLSARHLSSYGYPLETDPELARFASEAYLFENCFSNAPWTVPSFMALMTGLYSRSHQLTPGGKELWERWFLASNRWTLAESLRAAGYRTAGFVDWTWLTEEFGFVQGFDHYDASAAAGDYGDPERGIRKTTRLALQFLEGLAHGTSAFVFVHGFDVHGPYLAEPAAEELAGVEPYDLERRLPTGGSNFTFGIVPTYIARGEFPSGELPSPIRTAPFEKAYDEGIRFVDEELGKFFAALRDAGILERSWVIVTADHGETMSDAPLPFGHGLLTQDVLHVPLIVRPPGGCAGKRIPDAVQLADLYSTLTELAGIRGRDEALHGRSLVPLLRDEPRAGSIVLAETGVSDQAMLVADGWKLVELEPTKRSPREALISHPLLVQRLPSPARIEARLASGQQPCPKWFRDVELRRDVYERMPAIGLTEDLLAQVRAREGFPSFLEFAKRALTGPFYELYDLRADPDAKHDVAAQHPDRVAAMRALLEEEKLRRDAAAELARRPAEAVELPPEDIRALEALGYGGAGSED